MIVKVSNFLSCLCDRNHKIYLQKILKDLHVNYSKIQITCMNKQYHHLQQLYSVGSQYLWLWGSQRAVLINHLTFIADLWVQLKLPAIFHLNREMWLILMKNIIYSLLTGFKTLRVSNQITGSVLLVFEIKIFGLRVFGWAWIHPI